MKQVSDQLHCVFKALTHLIQFSPCFGSQNSRIILTSSSIVITVLFHVNIILVLVVVTVVVIILHFKVERHVNLGAGSQDKSLV